MNEPQRWSKNIIWLNKWINGNRWCVSLVPLSLLFLNSYIWNKHVIRISLCNDNMKEKTVYTTDYVIAIPLSLFCLFLNFHGIFNFMKWIGKKPRINNATSMSRVLIIIRWHNKIFQLFFCSVKRMATGLT